jgi:cbb3-type cytochrome oxidase subunit 3
MLKFIKHNLDTIAGIDIFPVISFLIFFIFFIGLFVWVAKMNKSELSSLSALPLNDGEPTNKSQTSEPHQS